MIDADDYRIKKKHALYTLQIISRMHSARQAQRGGDEQHDLTMTPFDNVPLQLIEKIESEDSPLSDMVHLPKKSLF